MKKFILFTFFIAIGFFASAQYFYLPPVNTGSNPGGLNNDDEFPFGGGLDASWTQIQGPSTTPVWSPVQTIPFTFNFNGSPVTQYKASTTGVVTFTTSATSVPSTSNTALPSASIPDNSAMVWGLNGSGSNDNIVIKTFGTAPNRQHWIFFASYSYPGLGGWTYFSVVLEEGTDKIYFVDQRNNQTVTSINLTIGVQINGSTAVQDVNSPNTHPNVATSLADRSDNWYWEFIPGTQSQFDMTATENTMNGFLNLSSAPFDVTGKLTNLGSATVTSFDLNYSVDGGATVTSNITGVNIASFADYNFTHPITWNPSLSQPYTIDIWASNINGNADENPSNDTISTIIQVVDTVIPRLALHEVFTSSSCGPCNPGNANLNSIFSNSSQTPVILKYQMSWPGNGDPYYTLEGLTRRQYYGVNSVPNMAVDGGWNGNTNSYTNTLLNQFSGVPAFMDIQSDIRVECKTVTVNVTVTPYSDFPGNNVLHLAVIEKLTFNNVSSNGETEFDHVMKKMLPNANGTTIGALQKNVPQTFTFSYTFNGNYILPPNATQPVNHSNNHTIEEFFDLDVVAFVQENGTKEVYQATFSQDLIGYDIGMANLDPITNASVGNPVPISGEIVNWKDSATSNLTLHYSVNGGTPVNQNLNNLNMDNQGDSESFSFLNSWTPTVAGNNTIKVWVDNFNGGNSLDDSPCNDTIEVVVNVTGNSAPLANFNYQLLGNNTVAFTDASVGATSWSWDFGDGNFSTDQNPTNTYLNLGTYQVCLVASNSNGSDTVCQSVNVVSGIADLNEQFFEIVPNPSNGIFTVKSDRLINGKILVMDLSGKVILEDEINETSSKSLNLQEYRKGIYLIKVIEENTGYTRKIIIE